MAKFRESAYVNDFVMFRNACEERKLKYTLSQIDRMKTNYNKQQDKERLFFAVQHLSVPSHRKFAATSNKNNILPNRNYLARKEASPSSPTMQQEKQSVNASRGKNGEQPIKLSDRPEKLLKNRLSLASSVSPIQIDAPGIAEECYDEKNGSLAVVKRTKPSSAMCFLTVENTYSRRSSTNSARSMKSAIPTSTSGDTRAKSSRIFTEEKLKNENKDLLSELIKRKKIRKEEKSQEANTLGLNPLPSKKVWEQQLNGLKPTDTALSRREQQEVARRARNRWRESFDNMKTRRLSSYQSKIFSSTEEKDTTFVKFLSKSQQAFYIKDIQFAQKFL